MATNKKKIIILCTMVVLLIASGYLNWVLTNKQPIDGGGSDTTAAAYFASAKAERQTRRNLEIAQCDAIIASASSSPEVKLDAETSKKQLISEMGTESDVEIFLFGKGYAQSIVSCNSNNINVIVMSGDLTALKVAEIKNFIVTQTPYVLNQIIISQYTA
jgi:hypothetical protein